METQKTDEYNYWLKNLADDRAKAKILIRVKRLEEGNPGDCGPVGEGVSELRIHYGPGYRVYYKQTEKTIVLLLCGGIKSGQQSDIVKAKRLAKEYHHD